MSKNVKLPKLDREPRVSGLWEVLTIVLIFGSAFIAFWLVYLLKGTGE